MSRPSPPTSPHFPFKLPFTALASIAHRLSGVALFFCLLPLLYLCAQAIESEASFGEVAGFLSSFWGKSLVFVFLASLAYHFMAAMRHLIQDLGHLEDEKSANTSALVVMGATGIIKLILLWGLFIA